MGLISGAPIYSDETLVGLLLIGVSDETTGSFHDRPAKLMAAAIDYASILTAVAGSALAGRRETGAAEARLRAVLDGRAFHVVFQPIVDLETREVVGFEALTRFSDGTPPGIRFARPRASGSVTTSSWPRSCGRWAKRRHCRPGRSCHSTSRRRWRSVRVNACARR